jgi:S1-C subfamily serine protease
VPFLGVAKDQDFPDMGGAHVLYPVESSGAGKAGIQAGDVIIEFDGRPVDNWNDMVFGLQRSRVGDKALLKVRRGAKELELEATLTRRMEGQ